jgi:hypothetical protein
LAASTTTGIPSKSQNVEPLGKLEGKDIAQSPKDMIIEDEALSRQVTDAMSEHADLRTPDGVSVAEYLETVKTEAQAELNDANLAQVAAACAIRQG